VRLFVGVEIADNECAALARIAEACRARVKRLEPRARVSWVPRDRLHVTVRFIGQVEEPTAVAVMGALEPSLSTPRFDVEFNGLGVFPVAGRLRVLCVGFGRAVESLVAVEQEVGRRLEACGLRPETRAYHPHVTLARIKDPVRLRGSALLDDLGGPDHLRISVDAITLFESRTSPQGVSYRPLLRTALARPV